MTAPRPVFPGRFLLVTRRCTQRTFLLRPSDDVNNTFVYLLGEAAKRFDIDIILPQMMSNHHHTVLYDRHGRQVEFREHFHKLLAKAQNAYFGRWENVWSTEEPSVVELASEDELLKALAYTATNPVKDGLVDVVHHWPGPNFVGALLSGKPLRARRPHHFFREDGSMPQEIELRLGLPDHLENKAEILAALRRQIGEVEEACARERMKTGRLVLGRRAVLRQHWSSNPASREPRRQLRPRVAARSTAMRIAMLRRNKAWEVAYRDARARWLAGESVEFPYGTYWLARFANVPVAPPPEPI
jgi:hypothetical protein